MISKGMHQLTSGRELEVLYNENLSDQAVIFHHGTPSDATLWRGWLEYLESKGIGAIAYSRAGYGNSDRSIGRNIVEVNDDISQILKIHGINKFVAVGWSGGGPHALANTLLPSCVGAITLAGVGKFGADDLDFLSGMGEENEIEFGAAVSGPSFLEDWMNQNAVEFAKVTASEVKLALGGLISQPDKDLLSDSYAQTMANTFQSGLKNGFWGWFDDDLAFVKDWGFDLKDVTKPVELWQGDLDLMVPHSHGIWLESKLSNSKLVLKKGEGHLSLGENARDEITDSIVQMLEGR
jgi:pimeloyl-ACP methyl ester carboxylesterase